MKKNTTLILAVVIAVLLAGGMVFQIKMQKNNFDTIVKEALKKSEGYDRKFVNTVNRLEEELATRASFGYEGGKDPMTGKKRRVVLPKKKWVKKRTKEPKVQIDPVKLTAIIYDDEKTKYTAVVMDGERSYSVEVGDIVRDRRITRITEDVIYMESVDVLFRYDIYGKKTTKKK